MESSCFGEEAPPAQNSAVGFSLFLSISAAVAARRFGGCECPGARKPGKRVVWDAQINGSGLCFIAALLVLTFCVYQGFRKCASVLGPLSATAALSRV